MEVGPAVNVGIEVYVDPDLCERSHHCQNHFNCVDMCSMGVFVRIKGDGVSPENSNICIMCYSCNTFCPSHAIAVRWTLRA